MYFSVYLMYMTEWVSESLSFFLSLTFSAPFFLSPFFFFFRRPNAAYAAIHKHAVVRQLLGNILAWGSALSAGRLGWAGLLGSVGPARPTLSNHFNLCVHCVGRACSACTVCIAQLQWVCQSIKGVRGKRRRRSSQSVQVELNSFGDKKH